MVQNVIDLSDKSRTCIQSFIRIYLHNLLNHLDNLYKFFFGIAIKLTALWPASVEANIDVLKVRLAASRSSFLLPLTMTPHWWLSFVEFEVTPLAPPLPDWKGIDLQVVF